jgi:hypothetical protein
MAKKQRHSTDIVLGEEYEDIITGLKGKATVIAFYLHACERVTLEFIKDSEVKYESFDAPRLKHLKTEKVATVTRTGGPGGKEPSQRAVPRR